MGISM
jgi:hypothetical protein